jgi:hypothetical protein
MWWRIMLAAGVALCSGVSSASAAELKLSFAELADIAQKVIGDAKIYLNNKPGGFLGLAPQSSVTLAGKQLPLPVPASSFPILDSRYAYFITDITSTAVRISPEAGAIRIAVAFEAEGPELAGGCVAGPCRLANALPQVEWTDPAITIDLAPVLVAGSVSLEVKSARLGGTLAPVCRNESGGISASLCNLSLPWARSTIQRLRKDVDAQLKDKVNEPAMQATIAAAFKPYLSVGSLGAITIDKVTSDQRSVVVAFRFGGS